MWGTGNEVLGGQRKKEEAQLMKKCGVGDVQKGVEDSAAITPYSTLLLSCFHRNAILSWVQGYSEGRGRDYISQSPLQLAVVT